MPGANGNLPFGERTLELTLAGPLDDRPVEFSIVTGMTCPAMEMATLKAFFRPTLNLISVESAFLAFMAVCLANAVYVFISHVCCEICRERTLIARLFAFSFCR